MSHIGLKIESGIATITIDRAFRFNSLDVETARDLRRAGLQVARDAKVRVGVLRGTNGVFCSGADLKYIRDGGDASIVALLPAARGGGARRADEGRSFGPIFKQILEYIHSTISEIRRAPKPFIAAVDGIAAAGGFGLAMSCDLVLASDRSTFEWAYSKTGLTGAESATFMLPRLIGLRRSLELLMLNPRLDAKRALDIGLVTRVYPVESFEDEVRRVAGQLSAAPTEALGTAKELLNQAAGMERLDAHLDRELENLARIASGADFAEGLSAFFEKRQPLFGAK
jgi:2-(1,2-epoxy-1,2-dihydrophenyl)acetyl-CoA isomerase